MQIDHPKTQCEHEACTCEVAAGQQYCSEYCRHADQFTDETVRDHVSEHGGCGCGHDGCTIEAD